MDKVRVIHADSRLALKELQDSSIDSVVTDPPYALVSIVKRFGKEGSAPAKGDVYAHATSGFMGKQWDTGETAFDPDFWREVLRVLKPGAHVVAFSGTRTYHRLACAIEDAGFEIRDQIAWLYGSGFPKSHNQKGEWEGWGTALKPALEPIVLARKPLTGTVASNVIAHGCGALNVDACRVEGSDEIVTFERHSGARDRSQYRTGTVGAASVSTQGRWPANVIHDGSDEVADAFPDAPGQQRAVTGHEPSSSTRNTFALYNARATATPRNDSGSAARFFYSAKADAEDRLGSKHPTVKPVDLMAYLCRLVTPPGGVVLDPFAGTGTTGLGAVREGFRAVLIEREAEYVADIQRRLAWARGEGRLTALETARVDPAKATGSDLPLFSGDAA